MDVPLEQASQECGDAISDSEGTASQPNEKKIRYSPEQEQTTQS